LSKKSRIDEIDKRGGPLGKIFDGSIFIVLGAILLFSFSATWYSLGAVIVGGLLIYWGYKDFKEKRKLQEAKGKKDQQL